MNKKYSSFKESGVSLSRRVFLKQTGGLGILAAPGGGPAIKLRGNPYSKATHGTICPRPHLALQQLYDPDRVKMPMKRTNPKKGRGEDPGFVPISWDEAMDTIADRMIALRSDQDTSTC